MHRWLIIPVILLTLVAACRDKEAEQQAKVEQEMLLDQTVPVTTVIPKIEPLEETLEISGPLKTLDQVHVGAKVPGKLVMVNIREGSRVRRGQVIAQVDTSDLHYQVQQAIAGLQQAQSRRAQAKIQSEISPQQTQAAIDQAKAALEAAKARLSLVRQGAREQEKQQAHERVNATKAQLEKAKTDLARARKLFSEDAIAQVDVDNAVLAYELSLAEHRSAVEALDAIIEGARPQEIKEAEEAVRQAEEQLRLAKSNASLDSVRRQQWVEADAAVRQAQAALASAKQQLRDAAIVSPIDGYIAGQPAQVGQVVGTGTPVATIVGLQAVYFEGQFSETYAGVVKAGQAVKVRVDANPNTVLQGVIVAINPTVDSLGRMLTARIALNNPTNSLKPGMFARGEIVTESVPEAILLPNDAVLKDSKGDYVFIVENQKAKRLDIEIGIRKAEWLQVKNMSPSLEVVLKGNNQLKEGSSVKVEQPEGNRG